MLRRTFPAPRREYSSAVPRLPLLLLAMLSSLVAAGPAVAAERELALRFSENMPGRITFAANASMTCASADPRCADTQAGLNTLNNNGFAAAYVDVDADPGTFSSSSANLRIPLGSIVKFAGLYWGGDAGEAAGAEPVLLRIPGADGYETVAASEAWSTSPRHYAGFADVTELVSRGGTGYYTVANVRGNAGGTDAYAGWSLVVAYTDATQPVRNQVVYDGYVPVRFGSTTGRTATINVDGFLTPLTGTVKTRVGIVAFEGDKGAYGDGMTLNGRAVSDAVNAANNLFNSGISTNNVEQLTRDPAHRNLLGFDADLYQLDGFLGNGQRSTQVVASTTNDNYYVTAMTMATDLYAPQLAIRKAIADQNGGTVRPGDVLTYTVAVQNTGVDGAAATEVEDAVPAGTDFVAGSIKTVNAKASFANGTVTASVGPGGRLDPGASASFTFSVRVQRNAVATTEIRNIALGTARGATAGIPLSFTSNTIISVVGGTSISVGGPTDATESDLATPVGADATTAAPKLAIDIRGRRTTRPGGWASFVVRVDNTGTGNATSTRACVDIPKGLSVVRRGGGNVEDGRLCWTRGVLAAGQTLRTAFTLRAAATAPSATVPVRASTLAANATVTRAKTTLAIRPLRREAIAVTG